MPTPYGERLSLKVAAGSEDGKLLRMRGHGAPKLKGSGKGDLLARLKVTVPQKLTKAERDALENLKKGGRIGNAQALLGNMLAIKPILEIHGGVVQEAAKQRTRKKALQWLPSGADVQKLTYDQFLAWMTAAKRGNGGKPVFGFGAGPKGLYHRFFQGFLLPSFTGG